MPEQLNNQTSSSPYLDVFIEYSLNAWRNNQKIVLSELVPLLKQQGAKKTLRSIESAQSSSLMTVHDGVVEQNPSGVYTAALNTDKGPLVLEGSDYKSTDNRDIQLVSSDQELRVDLKDAPPSTAEEMVNHLVESGDNINCRLISEMELIRFDSEQKAIILPILLKYIHQNRDSNDRSILLAVGSAIRKYIAIMPIQRMEDLADLLQSGHRAEVPVDIEIEVAKMIARNCETHPPKSKDLYPKLAEHLMEIVESHTHPRNILRDKNSAAASVSILAIFSLRSRLAPKAFQAAVNSKQSWFAELVIDDLQELLNKWDTKKHSDAADWLRRLLESVKVR